MKLQIVQKCRVDRKHRPVGEVLEFKGNAEKEDTWQPEVRTLLAAGRAVIVDDDAPVGPPPETEDGEAPAPRAPRARRGAAA